ncbi:HAMP domain-containing sensor histidine kinase [Roseibium sp. RKSG952]|uniref:sensor histidine kinase n=1 Tax=Roseibium sp. RKSG952 TaxID=2529384 RepID=UPI0012BBF726|nr:HAMP domain-containing sensor histidine kinase [Roseibium sp. RKSG952]MTI01984.1 HAMP domain-containing histidine kinase [Roseibium sp. RKSG952]
MIGGQPFKATLRALFFFLAIFSVGGWALVRIVENTLVSELNAQSEGESLLLGDIYEAEGQSGLVDTLHQMDRLSEPSNRVVSLLDANSVTLTGPFALAPDFVGVAPQDLSPLTNGRVVGEYHLSVHKLDDMTLVIGRSREPIQLAVMRLVGGLVVFGLINTIAILALGLWASRFSMTRLQEMNSALSRVSDGDLDVRLPVYNRDDQFDRIATRVNQNLDRLTLLVTGMKSTASAIAHDLKTPLSHLQIALHEIADAVDQQTDPVPKIDAALAEAEALGTIFDTMLRIARVEADRDQSRLQLIPLRPLVEEVAEFVRPMTEESNQTLVVKSQDVQIKADAPMIKQALVNLVMNASNHAGSGAEINVEIIATEHGATLVVRDTGPGIPEDDMDRALQPFVRMDAARTTPGSGLGLALVRAVVDRHGATLTLSDAKPGLCVSIMFREFKKN